MLERNDLSDELCELEKELAGRPAAELSQDLQAKIMRSVHDSLETTRPTAWSRQAWMRWSMAGIAVAAAVMLIVARLSNQADTMKRLGRVVENPPVHEEVISVDSGQSPSPPTVQHYRLALAGSPTDWEALLHRETDLFEDLRDGLQANKWRQGTSSLYDD